MTMNTITELEVSCPCAELDQGFECFADEATVPAMEMSCPGAEPDEEFDRLADEATVLALDAMRSARVSAGII
jgi:hypothetical protein